MKIYESKKEAEKDVVNGELLINDDVTFEFHLSCNWHIIARNIIARDIKALNIWAHDIKARNIKAYDIKAYDIDARDISAYNIDAYDIELCGCAFAFSTFKCKSIGSKREIGRYLCIDSEVIITGEIK